MECSKIRNDRKIRLIMNPFTFYDGVTSSLSLFIWVKDWVKTEFQTEALTLIRNITENINSPAFYKCRIENPTSQVKQLQSMF